MVWWLKKHRPDKRKVPIGPICIRFLYKTVSTGIFLLSGRCLVNSLRQKNKRPGPKCRHGANQSTVTGEDTRLMRGTDLETKIDGKLHSNLTDAR